MGAKMRIRTKPIEYDAIEFNGLTDDVLDFLKGSHAQIRKNEDYFVLSDIIGNKRLEVGDILYKSDYEFETKMVLISVLRKGETFGKHFEIVG